MMTGALAKFGPTILVLCCNDCGHEIYVVVAPEICAKCGAKFVHGWDAIRNAEEVES